MNQADVRKALLDGSGRKEIRTNDGRIFVVDGFERWALGGGRLVVIHGPDLRQDTLSIRNVASIGDAPDPVASAAS